MRWELSNLDNIFLNNASCLMYSQAKGNSNLRQIPFYTHSALSQSLFLSSPHSLSYFPLCRENISVILENGLAALTAHHLPH